MEPEQVVEHVSSDPELLSVEKEMSIGFTKQDDEATFFTCIASQIKRALTHSDMDVVTLSVFNESDETRSETTVEDFDGEGIVVGLKATVPIESLKINSSPRSSRSYGQIISSQASVNIEE
jgi:hypothetical protein